MYHKGKYYVSFKRGCEDYKRDVTVSVIKVFESDSLRITLSDDEDPAFLCVLTLTRMDYEDLKKQQGLLVDFDNFPAQLVRLLQQCSANNMFLIMQQTNPLQYFLEVIEHNEFRRLVHLSLRTSPATDSDIKQHMASTIKHLKDTLCSLKSTAASNESSFNAKCMSLENKIQELSHTISKMEDDKIRKEKEFQKCIEQERDKLAQERINLQKNNDMSMKVQMNSYQEALSRKEKEIENLNSQYKQFKDSYMDLEKQMSEKNQRLSVLEKEVQKSHIEVATLRANISSLEKEVYEKDRQLTHHSSKNTYLEKITKENADTIKELNNTVQSLRKDKSSLEERLALSESLVNKNNEVAHSTAEQLMKANQIISKQNADLIEMKEKILCRTAIALEQEKVIERNSKEMDELKSQINEAKTSIEQLQKDFDSLKEKHECTENTLKDRDEIIKNNNMVIQWLHKKLENQTPSDALQSHDNLPTQSVASSSTAYFITKNNRNDSLPNDSDDSMNFYATSKLSSIEESPEIRSKPSKTGLDPKYLKPSNNKNHDPKSAKSSGEIQRGKENTNINLPKVDYREKKSSRSNTYRATPVSAYFP